MNKVKLKIGDIIETKERWNFYIGTDIKWKKTLIPADYIKQYF
jgi:hypothetical protein